MSKTLAALRQLSHISHVDDERNIDNAIIVTLVEPYCFVDEPGCGVQGFDTVADAKRGCGKSKVYIPEGKTAPTSTPAAALEALPPKDRRSVVTILSQPAGTRLAIDWYEQKNSNFDRKSRDHIRAAAEAAGFVEYRGGHPWVTDSGHAWATAAARGAA